MDDEQEFCQMDFTTASNWETFISQLEEILRRWSCRNSVDNDDNIAKINSWIVKDEDVCFEGEKYQLSYYSLFGMNDTDKNTDLLENMMDRKNDYKTICVSDGANNVRDVHNLVQWFGLKEFAVFSPKGFAADISNEDKIKLVLSSFCVAAGNIKWEIPIFARVLKKWQDYFVGVCIHRGIRTEYQMVHLQKVPAQCNYLSGVIGVFKSKLSSSMVSLDPVSASVKLSYKIDKWFGFAWCVPKPSYNLATIYSTNTGNFWLTLPFGTASEPVYELILHATWPELLENVIVDSETYTDLEPTLAPEWSFTMLPEIQLTCLLSECMTNVFKLCQEDAIGDIYQRRVETGPIFMSDVKEPKAVTVSKLVADDNLAAEPSPEEQIRGPISNDVLMSLLYFLFPDADVAVTTPYSISPNKIEYLEKDLLSNMKSSAVGDLVWRLAYAIILIVYSLGDIHAVSHLWREFTQELRYRWENNIKILGVLPGIPDHKTCLLNQKLQMLNCCIEKRLSRKQLDSNAENTGREAEEDEFYDCQADSAEGKEQSAATEIDKEQERLKHSLWNQPEGRNRRCGDLRLINTGEYMYIPVTQEVTPKTEDLLEQDTALLLQLGTDSLGSELRSRLMSASLYSDMEAFKAANPGAELADFIRWYSPRDWIEVEELDRHGQKKGHLSPRMMLPGNMWQEVWDSSKPVPACRQKRLFDDVQEAEKVLHFLESTNPVSALVSLLPVFTHIMLSVVTENANPFPFLHLEDTILAITKKAVYLSKDIYSNLQKYKEVADAVRVVEIKVSQYKSLKYKLFADELQLKNQDLFIARLVKNSETAVVDELNSDIRNRIFIVLSEIRKAEQLLTQQDGDSGRYEGRYLGSSDSVFPSPFLKEFIVRVRTQKPSPLSRKLAQKLIAKVSPNQIVMAGCYSQDTVFM